MENRITLDRTAVVLEDNLVITEQIETKYTEEQIRQKLSNIQRDKERLEQENLYVLKEYERLLAEEIEFREFLDQLVPKEIVIEKIK